MATETVTQEIGQIIAQLKMVEHLRIITQNTNGENMKVLTWEDFTEAEQAQLQACVEMIKTK
jgi:uncharacterized protein YfkK (UPF0435 family)